MEKKLEYLANIRFKVSISSHFKIIRTHKSNMSSQLIQTKVPKVQIAQVPQFIGQGGFGTVNTIPGTNNVLKKMELKCNENLKELCFITSYKNIPFISQLVSHESNVKENWIKMTMKNAGKSFRDLKKDFPIKEKVKMVPKILSQFIRILIWMQQENLMHCDIKPANICMDNNCFVTLIDWGFVQKVHNKNNYWIGTTRYYDPFVQNKMKANFRSEIFAMGFSLCYFLTNFDMDRWDEFCSIFSLRNYTDKKCIKQLNKEVLDIIGLDKLKQLFIDSFGNTLYYNMISSMINIIPSYIIDLFDMFEQIPVQIRLDYPLTDCLSRNHKPIHLNNLNINLDEHVDLFDKVIKLKFTVKKCFSLLDTIGLFLRSLKIADIKNENIVNTIMIYWYISSVFNNDNAITEKNCQASLYVSEDEFYEKLLNLCDKLQFDIYPESENIEWNKLNEDIWRDIFINDEDKFNLNIFSPEIFEMLYDDFKISFLKNLEHIEDNEDDQDNEDYEDEDYEDEDEDDEDEDDEDEDDEDEDDEEDDQNLGNQVSNDIHQIEHRINEMMRKIDESVERWNKMNPNPQSC